MILPCERGTLSGFAGHPTDTGPYVMIRDTTNQLKIQVFDDFFDYRALVDEVNVWVLPEITDEPVGGPILRGPQSEEKKIESRLGGGCCYLLFGSRAHRGANQQVRDWVSHVLSPTNLAYFAEKQYQQLWLPACGLLPRWHHACAVKSEKPAGLESLTLTFYQDYNEHRVIAGIMQQILASHQVTLEIKETSYDWWHEREIESDIRFNSANSTLLLGFLLFAHSYEVPLLQHCTPTDQQADAAHWYNGEMNLANWCQQLVVGKAMVPLVHHWLIIQGQCSTCGLYMNILDWSGFKSAWFAPPNPWLLVNNKITTLTSSSTGCHANACAEKMPVEPGPDNTSERI